MASEHSDMLAKMRALLAETYEFLDQVRLDEPGEYGRTGISHEQKRDQLIERTKALLEETKPYEPVAGQPCFLMSPEGRAIESVTEEVLSDYPLLSIRRNPQGGITFDRDETLSPDDSYSEGDPILDLRGRMTFVCEAGKSWTEDQLVPIPPERLEEFLPEYREPEDGEEYEHETLDDCINAGDHLGDVDHAGYCNFCGYRVETAEDEQPPY